MALSKIKIKDIFSPERWRSVSIYLARKYSKVLFDYVEKHEPSKKSDLKPGTPIILDEDGIRRINTALDFEQVHIIEQYMYRFLACNKCLEEGKCINCSCAIPAKMFVRSDYCSLRYWEAFKDKETWEKYKKALGIKFNLTYNNR